MRIVLASEGQIPSRGGDVTPIQSAQTGRNVVVTIAFDDAQAL